jgi:tRNA A-37 threonylcarbamoyl transferase component Bud32
MLSPAEAELVQRDPTLPGLATLLDTEAFLAALRRALPGADLRTARITYIKYKPRTNCLVSYRLDLDGTAIVATAKAYSSSACVQLRKARGATGVPSAFSSGRLVLDDCAVSISLFPNDSEVKSLRRLTNADVRHRMIRRVFRRDRCELWGGAIEALAYKPERRYVAKLSSGEEPRAVLKFYAEPEYRAARDNSQAFESRGLLRLAPRIGYSDRYRVLAFEWLPGKLLREAILDADFDPDTVGTVGAALAELHAQNPGGLPCLTRETETAALVFEADGLGFLCPHLARRAGELAQKLAARLIEEPPVNRPIHGDFHGGQVLLSAKSVGLLDLDRAVRADPMGDLGLFIAHFEREVVRGNLASDRVELLAEALLEGYRVATRTTIPSRVQLRRVAGLLRLAPECFRYFEPGWPNRAEAILQRAEEVLRSI